MNSADPASFAGRCAYLVASAHKKEVQNSSGALCRVGCMHVKEDRL